MGVTLGDIILYLGADDSRLNSTLKSVEGKAGGWVKGLGGTIALGIGGALTAAIGGATALGLAAFKAGGDLDAAYDTLLIKTGASGEALEGLQSTFRAVFESVPTQAEPAANVLSLLYNRLNLTGEGAQTAASQILEMSRMMGTDATAAADSYTRMIKDAGLSSEEASDMLDKIFVASQKSGIGLDRLMGLAVQFGGPMRQLGFTVDDTVALLSKWEAEGVNTELVMGSLRIAIGKFADEGKPLRESLMDTFDAIKNNEDATAALAKGMEVFGARAGADMTAAIREGRFEIEDMLAVLGDADGAIMSTSSQTMDWGEKLTLLKNKASTALAPIGMKLMDLAAILVDKAGPGLEWLTRILDQHVAPAVDKVVGVIDWLFQHFEAGNDLFTVFEDGSSVLEGFFKRLGMGGEQAAALSTKILAIKDGVSNFLATIIPFIQEHGPAIKNILLGVGAGLAAFAIISTVVGWITGLIAAVTAASGVIAAAGGGIAGIVALLGGPVTLVIAAVAGLIALLAIAWNNNWGDIQGKTRAVVEWIRGAIPQAIQFINDFVNGRLGILSQIFKTTWTNIQIIFQAFRAAFDGDWRKFGELLRQAWDNAWRMMGVILTTAWTNIKTGVKNGIQAVKEFFTETDWGEVGENILRGMARGITSGLGIIRDAARNAAQAALDAAKGFLGIESPSKAFDKEVGEPSAEGFGQGFARRMGEIGTGVGQEAIDGFGGLQPAFAGAGGGGINFTYVDQRFISLTDEFEAERILRPIFDRLLRQARPTG